MRLRGVERGADVQRGPERAIDLLLDAALSHAKIRRGPGTVADALVRRRVRLQSRPRVAVAQAANNYASLLVILGRFEEVKSLLLRMIPVARRVLGVNHDLTLRMRLSYATALYCDTCATLDDLREAVTTLEDAERIARRVLGGAHPATESIGSNLREVRAELRAGEARSGKA